MSGIRQQLISTVRGQIVRLGDVSDIYQPLTISSSDLTESGYPVYGANGRIGYYHSYNHDKEQICITCRGNTCGTINYTPAKSWITGNSMVINTDNQKDIVNKRYLFHFLSTISFQSIISGSGQPQIVRSPLQKLKIVLPEIRTQNHIARCLDMLTERLEVETRIKIIFQLQKDYLLQSLFI